GLLIRRTDKNNDLAQGARRRHDGRAAFIGFFGTILGIVRAFDDLVASTSGHARRHRAHPARAGRNRRRPPARAAGGGRVQRVHAPGRGRRRRRRVRWGQRSWPSSGLLWSPSATTSEPCTLTGSFSAPSCGARSGPPSALAAAPLGVFSTP